MAEPATYHVENFGCRASRADGEAIAASLESRGLATAPGFGSSAVVVLNTCSVTAEADKDARAFLRKVKRANPDARVVVTGCYAQRAPEEVAALPGVDHVVGNSHKALVAEAALRLLGRAGVENDLVPLSQLLADDRFAHSDLASAWPLPRSSGRTRPNLKVQDGCGNRCSFCIIPTTRGPSRSVPLGRVLEAARRFAGEGGQEMVLSGINLGRWGRDLQPRQSFSDLVGALLRETGLPRLRISSVEPMDWSDDLLDLFAEFSPGVHPRLARHAHLPLQSGSDAMLRAMHRRYRPWHYAARLEAIRAAMPEAAIGADVMVGFPGETDAHFEQTYSFVEQQPFTYLHLFPFSARPGTPAWTLHRERPVPGEAVRERMAALRALADRKYLEFCRSFAGRELSVITLRSVDDQDRGRTRALSDNFLTVRVQGDPPANRMLLVRITGMDEAGLLGAPVGEREGAGFDRRAAHPCAGIPDRAS